ncbi:Phenylalanyl Amino-acyl tRNA Synthetase [Meloidogyne graminicola]|uniref:Phenylalanyl Amino-acyl tRNA Synthetase n=1 Tax=Meloidogyne graminicola TaxID=189291 RepID=A0A8S9ZVP1_9BILA|nr:Phenylalanyl Amino-acyl tRNA Synthetase [Meloidogyne graminicola]
MTSSSFNFTSNSNLNREDSFTNLSDIMGERAETFSTTSQMTDQDINAIMKKIAELELKINQSEKEKIKQLLLTGKYLNLKEDFDKLALELNKSKEEKAYFLKISNKWKVVDDRFLCCISKCVINNPNTKCNNHGFIQITSNTNIKYNCNIENKNILNKEGVIWAENCFKKPESTQLCLNCSTYTLCYYEIKFKIEKGKPLIVDMGLRYSCYDYYIYFCLSGGYISYYDDTHKKDKFINLSSSFSFNNEDIIGCGVVYPPPNINNKLPYIFFTKNGELIVYITLYKIFKKRMMDEIAQIANEFNFDGTRYKPGEIWNISNKVRKLLDVNIDTITNESTEYEIFENESRIVSTKENFKELFITRGNPFTSPQFTYYVNEATCIRSHICAHLSKILSSGYDKFVICGDVYVRNGNQTAFPCSHQLAVLHAFTAEELSYKQQIVEPLFIQNYQNQLGNAAHDRQIVHSRHTIQCLNAKVRASLNKLIEKICGKITFDEHPASVPFMTPSRRLTLQHNWQNIEVAHFGIVDQRLMEENGHKNKVAFVYFINLDNLTIKAKKMSSIAQLWSKEIT